MQDSVVDAGSARIETMYREHAARMWRALFGFAGDRDIASDALAEAFAWLVSPGQPHGGGSVRPPA
jgi:DNA-directed RNA polymerase specialized sigma24 family protein